MSVEWEEGGREKRGPSWSELVDQAIRELGFGVPELLRARGTDLQILEYFRLKNNRELAKLLNWLVREMRPPDDALRDSLILRELSALERCQVFYTTFYAEKSLILKVHLCFSVPLVGIWIAQVILGFLRLKGRMVRAHRATAVILLILRTGNCITAFFV